MPRSRAHARARTEGRSIVQPALLTAGAAAAALAWALWAAPAGAQEVEAGTFAIDETHVHAAFRVSHLGFSETIGNFDEVSGSFTLDPADPSASSVSVTIATASIDTAHEERDAHLRGEDFFKVEKFPEMTFVSTAVEPTGDTTANVTGDLTMLGVTKPVTLDVTFNKAGPHPFNGKYVAGFSATGTLDRTEWGMEYGAPAIGTEVTLMIEAEGIRAE